MSRDVSGICRMALRAGSFHSHVSFLPRNNYVLSLAPEDEVTVIQWQTTPLALFSRWHAVLFPSAALAAHLTLSLSLFLIYPVSQFAVAYFPLLLIEQWCEELINWHFFFFLLTLSLSEMLLRKILQVWSPVVAKTTQEWIYSLTVCQVRYAFIFDGLY